VAKQRDRVKMTADEVAEMLGGCRKVQLATINPDGAPHLVTMYYAMVDGKIAFWTYRTSQKALNLARDPRITCLVETGEAYFDLRGVQIQGVAETITDPGEVYKLGLRIGEVVSGATASTEDPASGELDSSINEYVANAARKRYAYLVEPRRVASWDHTKLLV
jgi:PPOX class probable F420-dependent enzyme